MTFRTRFVRPLAHAALCIFPLLVAGCADDFTQDWAALPDTALLYSLSRSEYIGQPSAYDLVNKVPVAVEQVGVTGRWDFALVDHGNELALMPASGFGGLDSRAGIATVSGSFDEVREAPRDTAAFTRGAVVIRRGTVYVIRSRRESCGFGSGVHYGKLEPLEIDRARGTLRFRVIVNPFCNDRRLIPPDED